GLGEGAEFDFLQHFSNLLDASALRRLRISNGAAKRADGQIRSLRQNQQLCPRAHVDVAVTPGPHAREGAREGALAGSRLAGDQHLSPGIIPTSPPSTTRALPP